MIDLPVALNIFIRNAPLPIGLLAVLIFFLLVLNIEPVFSSFKRMIDKEMDKNSLRLYLVNLIVFIILTFAYWVIDLYVYDLPDPTFPYIFYMLMFTVTFGIELSLITGLLLFLLVDYYLFYPMYSFYAGKNPVTMITSLVGVNLALYLGIRIRRRMKILEKETINLKSLLEARDRYTAAVVHDLKNPITTIKLYTQLLRNSKNPPKNNYLIKSTQTINKESDRLLTMVNELMDFSKFQNNKIRLNKKKFDLCELCKGRLKIMKTMYKNYNFDYCSTEEKAHIWADKNAIDRAITNLLINAVKYSPEKSTVTLELRKTKENCFIVIKDEGEGIPKDKQDLIFEPFFQLKNKQKGLGMGLFIVKSIIESHGGKVVLESRVGNGSSFWISIPNA